MSGSASAAPVPSPKRRSSANSGSSSRRLEGHPVADLDRPMGGDQVAARGRAQLHRQQRRGGGDETIHDDHGASGRGADDEPDQGGDLQAADLDEHVQRIARPGLIDRERALDDPQLVRPGAVVDAGAAARDFGNGEPVTAATMAEAAVVLPMPISPRQTTSATRWLSSRPTPIAASA